MSTMNAVAFYRYGPPEVLVATRLPRPQAGPGEVVLAVRSVAVERAGCHLRAADPPVARLASGLFRPRRPVPGGTLAGEVVAVGADVPGVRCGDRVAAVSLGGGGYAEQVAVRAAEVVPIPDAVPFDDAVAVVEGGLTALPFLRDHGRVGVGTRLLVHGAAGAIGVLAVQVGAGLGATVTGVCSTRNVELVRSLGAEHVVDRTVEDFTTAGEAYDVVFDTVGASSFTRARRALTPSGSYLTTVPSAAIGPQMLCTRLVGGQRAVLGLTGLRSVGAKATDMAHLLELTAAGRVRAVVDRQFPLDQAADAERYVETGRKRGAVLLHP